MGCSLQALSTTLFGETVSAGAGIHYPSYWLASGVLAYPCFHQPQTGIASVTQLLPFLCGSQGMRSGFPLVQLCAIGAISSRERRTHRENERDRHTHRLTHTQDVSIPVPKCRPFLPSECLCQLRCCVITFTMCSRSPYGVRGASSPILAGVSLGEKRMTHFSSFFTFFFFNTVTVL